MCARACVRRMDDVSKRNADMGNLREVIREKNVTVHPPPAVLYSHAASFRFPRMHVTPLAGDDLLLDGTGMFAGRWSLVGCAGSQFAQSMVDGWLTAGDGSDATAASEAEASSLQTMRLSLIDGVLLAWLRRPLLVSMRMSVPRERHAAFMCHFGDSTEARRALHMQNRYLGYVCLVDPEGVVRWHVHGNEPPDERALGTLRKLVHAALASC
jgi:hypothetical protein